MKYLLVLFIFFAQQAHAGFLLGYVVGASGNTPGKQVSSNQQIIHADHDVIVCETPLDNRRLCKNNKCNDPNSSYRACTPEQYAVNAGYMTLHKVGAIIESGNVYIIMEVSR